MTAEVIDGVAMAAEIRAEVAEGVAEVKAKHGVTPGIAVVLVGDNPASAIYVRNKDRAATEAGMEAQICRLPAEATQDEVLGQVSKINEDPRIHGMIVQLPLPDQVSEETVIEAINPDKDVDGLHPANMGRLMAGMARFVPGTPAGVQQMLIRTGHDPSGQHVVICGRSNIVGKPLANLLMQRLEGANSTVTVCHTRTRELVDLTRQADVIVAAMGVPEFVTGDMVKEGVVAIDVGINRVDAPERKRGYKLVGDIHYESVAEKAAAITPVPGGVGPMTIAMLLNNTLKATRRSIHPEA